MLRGHRKGDSRTSPSRPRNNRMATSLSAASCGGHVTQAAPRTGGGRVAWLSPYETVVDSSGCDAGAAHPHTHPYPPSLAQIDARAGRARSGFGKARVGQRRRSPQACTGRQRCEGRRRRATLRRLGAQGIFMRTEAGTLPLSVLTSPWRSTCRLGEAARHRACIQFALASRSFFKIMFPSYPPTPRSQSGMRG